jgi:hypothetical protein
MVIEKGTQVRVKIIGIRSEVGEMWAIGSIKEDYLGCVAAPFIHASLLLLLIRNGGCSPVSYSPPYMAPANTRVAVSKKVKKRKKDWAQKEPGKRSHPGLLHAASRLAAATVMSVS